MKLRWQHTSKHIYRYCQVTVLVLLIGAALFVSIGRLLVGVSDYYRPDLEETLSLQLGMPIKVGTITGSWSFFDPRFTTLDVVLGDPDSPSVRIDRATIQVGSLYSFLKRSLVITEVEIQGIGVSVAETAPGHWSLSGMPVKQEPMSLNLILDSLPYLNVVQIRDVSVVLNGIKSDYVVQDSEGATIQLTSNKGQKTLQVPVSLTRISGGESPRQVSSIYIAGEYDGDFRDADFSGRFYVDVPAVRLGDFLHGIEFFNDFNSFNLNGEFWLEVEGSETKITSRAEIHSSLDREGDDLEIGSSMVVGVVGSAEQFTISSDRIDMVFDDQVIHVNGLQGVVDRSGGAVRVGMVLPVVDLGEVSGALGRIGTALLNQRIIDAIAAVSPRGELTQTAVYVELGDTLRDLRITSLVKQAAIQAYLGSPAISSLNGLLSLGLDSGYIDINNGQFDMHFKSMFTEIWPFDSARGRINYRSDGGVMRISSGLIELNYGGLSAYGKLQVNLAETREKHTWGLAVGVNNGDLLDAHRYLPNTLSPNLLAWLNQSVNGGTAVESGLLFHGSLFRGAPKVRKVFDTFLKVKDAVLDYHPEWPAVSGLSSTIYLGNKGVYSADNRARVLDSNIISGIVRVPISFTGEVDTVFIDAKVAGSISDGVRILNETPVASQIAHVADNWSGTGDITGQMKLEIPIGPRTGEDPYTDINIKLHENSLVFPDYDIRGYGLVGDVRYETESGLTSKGFTAQLFNETVSGFISSDLTGKTGQVIINIAGTIDAADLYQWSGQSLLSRVSGKTAYRTAVHIAFGGDAVRSYIESTSDLTGIHIDAPFPLSKRTEEQRPLYYRQEFLEPGFQIDLVLGELQASLRTKDDLVTGGRILLGTGEIIDPTYEAIRAGGSLSYADYEEWDRFFIEMEALSEVSLASELADRVDLISLEIRKLNLYALELEDVATNITRSPGAWSVNLRNDVLSGVIGVADDDHEPLKITLDYLRFLDDGGSADPMMGVVPQDLGNIDFQIVELKYGDEDYGSWSFQVRPHETGAKLQNLSAQVRGLSVLEGAELDWSFVDDEHRSAFKGAIVTDDLGNALHDWGYASSIEGSDFRFVADFGWDGTPAAIDLELLTGSIQISNGKGRFVQAEAGSGPFKLLGVFDFAQLARRFRFDFSDVVEEGWSFNKIAGAVNFNRGVVDVSDEIVIEGSTGIFKVGGHLDLFSGALDNDLIATLPVSRNLPWYAAYSAIATGPLIGAGVMLAQKVFGSQIDQMTSAKYKITGTIEAPIIQFVTFFDDSVRETGSSKEAANQ